MFATDRGQPMIPGLGSGERARRRRRTRIWRALVLVAVVAVAMTQVVFGGAQPRSATVTVGRGDSLWLIASREYPNLDPRQGVIIIESANHISNDVIYVGERLTLPSSASGTP